MNRQPHKHKVLVRITGGLGNQLFQLAAGISVSTRIQAEVFLDTEAYGSGGLRRYRMDQLLDPPAVMPSDASASLLNPSWISRRLLRRKAIPIVRHLEASYFPGLLDLNSSCYLDGYWQSLRYFEGIQDEIRKRFRFREATTATATRELCVRAECRRVVSVHVRRGDYVSSPSIHAWHGVLTMDYYSAAIRVLEERFAIEELYLFTDDPSWAAEHFSYPLPITIVSAETADELQDLEVMRSCQYHVIANSSFSWWGAWLSDCRPEAVVAPKRWFATAAEDSSNIVPAGWFLV